MTSNKFLLLLMVLWINRNSGRHFSFGVFHMVAARFWLGFSHPKNHLSWIFKVARSHGWLLRLTVSSEFRWSF